MNTVTDTHALLWWFIDSPKISSRASEIFEKCQKEKVSSNISRKRAGLSKAEIEIMEEEAKESLLKNSDELQVLPGFSRYLSLVTCYTHGRG